MEKELAASSRSDQGTADSNPDWRIEREVLLAENSLLTETVADLRLQMDSKISALTAELQREKQDLLLQVKDLSSQLISKAADSQQLPLPDEVTSSALSNNDIEELRRILILYGDKLKQVRRANSKLLQQVQSFKGNIQVLCLFFLAY